MLILCVSRVWLQILTLLVSSSRVQYTDPAAIKRSRIKSPECVANLSKPSFVQR